MGKVISMAKSAEDLARNRPDLAAKYAQSTATMRAVASEQRYQRNVKLIAVAIGLVLLAAVLL